MPGNKHSGRKKKLVREDEASDDELDLVSPPKEKVPRGRPRKTDTAEDVSLTDYTYLPPT